MATPAKEVLDLLYDRIKNEALGALTADLCELINATANLAAATAQDETMSMQEVAEVLNIAVPRAYELAKREDFPALLIGKSNRVSRVAFFRWMQQRQVIALAS